MPLEKESLNNFLPDGFETNNLEGYKENFSADKIATGYEKDVKDRVSGPNFNNLLDVLGKNTNVLTKFMDFIKNMPVGNIFVVDENNQLVYKDINEVGGGGLEIGDVAFTQMAIDESKGKRRKLNGQIILQEQYQQLTNILKASIAQNPDLACTEQEWQAEVTMSTAGICYKFVVDDEGGTIRLPKYPEYFIGSVKDIAPAVGNGLSVSFKVGDVGFGLGKSRVDTGVGALIGVASALYGAKEGTDLNGAINKIDYLQGLGLTNDPKNSGIEAQIKQEKIKGNYFIQVATGAETEDNIINEIELNNPFSLLDYKYSEYELNNLSWLRSNGQWNSNAVYPAVYELLLKIYNGAETKAGVSVKLSTASYSDYDFVVNTSDETFRLPIKVNLASGKAVVGNGMALGMTDGTNLGGTISFNYTATSGQYLAYRGNAYGSNVGTSANSGDFPNSNTKVLGITTDPTKSGIELSDSNLYLYFYVGETVQNANLVNVGRIEEKVASLIPDNSDLICNYVMQSTKYIDLTLGASATKYIAPANGYFVVNLQGGGIRINTIPKEGGSGLMFGKIDELQATLPVEKGGKMVVRYGNITVNTTFRFYYMKGAV